jgi:type III pantothenate kinase
MLLLVDIGNTNITIGVSDGGQLVSDWRLSTRDGITADEFWVLLRMLLDAGRIDVDTIQGFALSSVVPNLTPIAERAVESRLKVPLVNVTSDLDLGLEVRYDNPHAVGADRLCNAVAGHARYGGPLVIVDFGTATTFDIVSRDAAYLGGIIAPGPETTIAILHAAAAKLPAVELVFPPSLIGSSTEESMQAGIMLGGVAMIDGLVRQLRGELGEDLRAIATGGLARVFFPRLETVEAVEPTLTLDGLRLIFERCA